MVRLSIITVCLNDFTGLEKTIKSVITQTFTDFEYIIVDGGSTDGSRDLLNRYASNITYSVSEKDSGIYNAMNKGIAKATGEYCLFLNAGDYLVDESVLQKVFIGKPKADIVYCDMLIDEGKKKLKYGKQPDSISFEFMIKTTLWHPVSFIKRTLFDKLGYYNETWKIVSDYEFFLRAIFIEKCSTFHLPFPISIFNTKGIGSSPEHDELHQRERKLVQNKYFDSLAMETAERLNSLKKSKAVVFSSWVNEHRMLKGILSFLYDRFKWVKKVFS